MSALIELLRALVSLFRSILTILQKHGFLPTTEASK